MTPERCYYCRPPRATASTTEQHHLGGLVTLWTLDTDQGLLRCVLLRGEKLEKCFSCWLHKLMASLIQFYNPVIDQWLSRAHSMQNCKAKLLSEHLGNNSMPTELFPPSLRCWCQIQIRDDDGMLRWIPQTFAIVPRWEIFPNELMRQISEWKWSRKRSLWTVTGCYADGV